MKKIIAVCLLTLVICSTNLLAQGRIEPSDNIAKWLCHTWQFDYGEFNGKREEDNAGEMKGARFIFKTDKTFELRYSTPEMSQSVAGTWKYDPLKKMIFATIKHPNSDPTVIDIISLSDTEMKSRYSIYESGSERFAYIIYKIAN
jgi:hypothetical protein